MPKNIQCISIFISCPSNMAVYIEKIEGIVDEFNEIFGFEKGIIFRTIHWKKNAVGHVTSDPQLAINSQLMDDYDLLVALIGDRLGEATARAESGTAEEIRIALSKKDSTFGGKHVQILFKTRLELNIHQVDTDQLIKVKEFKKNIQKMALVAEFKEDDEIDGIINRFLSSACQQLEGRIENLTETGRPEPTEVSRASEVLEKPDEELGFYDEIEKANQASRAQADLIGSYAEILSQMTVGLNEILTKYGDDQQKRRFDEIGEFMSSKAESMEKIIESIKDSTESHSSSFENVLLMLDEFNNGGNVEELKNMRGAISEAKDAMSRFMIEAVAGKEAAEKSPRATQRFNVGKRRVAKAMGEMIDVVQILINRFNEYISYLDAFLQKRN